MDLFAPWHLVILIGAILLLFGGQKIPELMGGIGKGMKEFKKSFKDGSQHQEEPPAEIPKSTSKPERLKD
jgi:sec-independent protein translocase protein TatA